MKGPSFLICMMGPAGHRNGKVSDAQYMLINSPLFPPPLSPELGLHPATALSAAITPTDPGSLLTHSFIHTFILACSQHFFEHLLCTRLCSHLWGY